MAASCLAALGGDLHRIDPATSAIVKARTVPLAGGGGLAYGDGSLWLAGGNSVLRIDPSS